MQAEQILSSIVVGTIIGVCIAIFRLRRRKSRSYTQSVELPAFTDSMPRERIVEVVRVSQVAADARLLLHYRYRGSAASRRQMARHMSERRWAAAALLLRDLHVYRHGADVPQVSERLALRRLRTWEAQQSERVGHFPAYVSSR
jgi:hypothetical protein